MNKEIETIFNNTIGNKNNSFVYNYDKDCWYKGDPFKLFAKALKKNKYNLEEAKEELYNVYYIINGETYTSTRQVINVFEIDKNGYHGAWEYIYRNIEEDQYGV